MLRRILQALALHSCLAISLAPRKKVKKPTIPQIERIMDQLRKLLFRICGLTTESSLGTDSLEIGVTRTFGHTAIVAGGDGIPDSGIVCEVSSGNNDLSLSRPSLRYTDQGRRRTIFKQIIRVCESYTLVRLSELGQWESEVLEDLDRELVKDVASIIKLDDGSIEMVVLLTYLPTLQDKLGKKFPLSKVDPSYAPYDATEIFSFIQRAQFMIRTAWPTAAALYSYLQISARVTVLRSITHWECHECGAGNRIMRYWKVSKHRKVCENSECGHKHCSHCFFLSKNNERVLYCDGTEYKANTNGDPEYVPPVRE